MEFNLFKNAVAKQFELMHKHGLFRSKATKDDLWDTYLKSFPEGSNPILKERTEHDCTCCKQFIRSVGDAVAIIDGKLVSIWDVTIGEPNYQAVADALSKLVHANPIEDSFLSVERVAGTDRTFSDAVNGVRTWNHFFVNIPTGKSGQKNYVVAGADIGTKLGLIRASHDVFKRGLDELTLDSLDTVLELTANGSLYRGDEFKGIVTAFRELKVKYSKVPAKDRDNFVWSKLSEVGGAVLEIRNSMIGSLLIDLSKGDELEDAVKSFEQKAAPANYKRPKSLVTKAQIESAKKKIEELGFTSALERRYAVLGDITVNNILFADRTAKKAITGDVFDDIASSVVAKQKNLDKVEEVSIEKFIADILPTASSLEIMLDNTHAANLVSLIAPADPTAKNMFKWDNKFSWTYAGDAADSIKERVKAAGGNVTGEFCCRLAWNNTDDLDFHMTEPDGYDIYFGNRSRLSTSGGKLDVDANGGSGMMDHPVENIFYDTISGMREGTYKLYVNQWSKRQTSNFGFEVEIELNGTTYNFAHDKIMSNGQNVVVAEFEYSRKNGLTVKSNLSSSKKTKVFWGVPTQTYQKVNVVMLSPNYWDENGSGNKHYFFMIDGCENEGKARGFYNEFLTEELNAHRKVIEIVGSKMKTDTCPNQLSGVGFSSTQRNSVLFRVNGKFTRVVKVVF